MCEKYNVKKWELDEVFKHKSLKGKRPAHVKKLSFTFIDDTGLHPVEVTPSDLISDAIQDLPLNSGDIAVEQAEVQDPNQVTLEQAIDDTIQSVEAIKTELKETEAAVLGMLSPTEFETPEITGIPNGDTMSDTDDDEIDLPSFEDTLDLVKEQEMEVETETEVEVEDEFGSFQI